MMHQTTLDQGMISIVIPAYNEEEGIGGVIEGITTLGIEGEIIVVDDGSEDNTADIVREYQGVRLIRHDLRRGYGAAIKTGIRHARGEIILVIDADGTYPHHHIPALISGIVEEDYDMVVGARVSGDVHIPMLRRPAKWLLRRLAEYLSGTRIPDLNSGMRAMRRAVMEDFFHILPEGFSFTTTITLAMLTNGYRIKYMPVDYYKRGGRSKIRPIQDTFNFIQLIIRTVLFFNPLRVFIPLSISLVILAFLVLYGSWLIFGRAMDVTFGVILMTAVMVMAIGMLADLIDKRLR